MARNLHRRQFCWVMFIKHLWAVSIPVIQPLKAVFKGNQSVQAVTNLSLMALPTAFERG